MTPKETAVARVKNITDDPADIPSLGVFAVQPGETAEVPNAKAFKDSEMWQPVGAKTEENPK